MALARTIEKNGQQYKLVWMEDDALPKSWSDNNHVSRAYKERYGEELVPAKAESREDYGDCMEYVMPGGRLVWVTGVHCDAIYELLTDSERDL